MNIVMFSNVPKVANKEVTRLVTTYPSSLSFTSTISSSFMALRMFMKFNPLHKELKAIMKRYTPKCCIYQNNKKKKARTKKN